MALKRIQSTYTFNLNTHTKYTHIKNNITQQYNNVAISARKNTKKTHARGRWRDWRISSKLDKFVSTNWGDRTLWGHDNELSLTDVPETIVLQVPILDTAIDRTAVCKEVDKHKLPLRYVHFFSSGC